MKKLILLKIVATALLFTSCENFQSFVNNTPPSQVQADIVALGTVARPYVTPAVAQKLHNFAVQVQSTNDYAQLVQLLPHTGNQSIDKLISTVTLYVVKGGPYATAVGQGLLANF